MKAKGQTSSRRGGDTTHPPFWVAAAGAGFAAVALLFFMALVGAAVVGYPVPCSSRFLVVVIFALVVALASAFIGGTASAKGMATFAGVPVAIGTAGGIAVLFIALGVGNAFYLQSGECSDLIQRVRLLGRVMDTGSVPIAGATVTVEGYNFFARSDATGSFDGELGAIKLGTFIHVRVTHSDFVSDTRTFPVNGSEINLNEIRLNHPSK